MTSDAKIGLLFGLVFIFIIAFLINGLPTLRNDQNNNEFTTTDIVTLQNGTLGIGSNERDVIRRTTQIEEPRLDKVQPGTTDNQQRFTMSLSDIALGGKETNEVKPPAPPAATEKKENAKVEAVKATSRRVYVVAAGDTLTVIAKRFYGAEEGNRLINIARLFQANRGLLKSPDEIYEGQKIIIPPLRGSGQNRKATNSILINPIFEKVESIGRRNILSDGSKTRQNGQYAVREGDSLWRIAAEELGDSSRYTEIAKLNAGILNDEDSLAVGMRLKMPVQ